MTSNHQHVNNNNNENQIKLNYSHFNNFIKNQIAAIVFKCALGSRKPARLSSKEYSINPSGIISFKGAGVIAVCIGIETVDGVQGIVGIMFVFGVLFSSCVADMAVLEGVVKGVLVWKVFCNISCFLLRSSNNVMLDFDDSVEEMGENGVRNICWGGSTSLRECFRLAGSPAMSKPLLPERSFKWVGYNKLPILNSKCRCQYNTIS